jgi:HPt (histidine-containing phosphotransfer) domain-containing protein
VAAPATLAEPATLPAAGIDSEAALKRMGGLQSIYMMALRSFEVEAVKLAAQIDAAHAAREAAAVAIPLHTLKGLAGTIGAARLQEVARRAEAALKQGADAAAWAQVAQVVEQVPGVIAATGALLPAPGTGGG